MPAAICELYAYGDWASSRVFDASSRAPDAELDRKFEIGPGTLRKTLKHIYGAERIWCERVGTRDEASNTLDEAQSPYA